MPYLQQLWLNHNRLTRLPVGLPPSVRRLLVESNSIRAATEDAFPVNGSQLVAMSLADNHISTLQRADLRRLPLLRALDISVNNIRRLQPDVFADNTRMRNLQLSRNPLSHLLSGCFHGLTALRRLSLAFVPSAEVHVASDVFNGLPALTALDLDSSPAIARALMQSDSLMYSLSSVRELGLLNTQLTRLPPDLPRYFPALVVVRMSSSRWHCDASAAVWMRSWMSSTGVEVIGAGEILCLTPPALRGRSLLTIADWELDGELPSVPIVFRPATVPTTTAGYVRSPLDWPRRPPANFDEYADVADIDFRSAIYDDDSADEDVPDVTYDSRSRVGSEDVNLRTSDVAQFYSALMPTRRADLELPVVHQRLTLANTTARTASSTNTEQHDKAEPEVQQSVSSGQNHVVLLATLTIVVTMIIVVVIVAAILTMTRRKVARNSQRPTSIELQRKTSSNGGVKQNGRAHSGRRPPRNAAEDGLIGNEVPRLPVVAFTDQADSGLDDVATAGATDLNCSVEALSLIPGRDINHEGPHRVYQWTDF